MPGVQRALVIAGSDRRGAAFALFAISRQMGVSPWTWWADVPVAHHAAIYVRAGLHVQPAPSVQYRGIFLNDEDWGLRPWAAKKMDPAVDNGKGNIGPNTYERSSSSAPAACELAVAGDASRLARVQRGAGEREAGRQVGHRDR